MLSHTTVVVLLFAMCLLGEVTTKDCGLHRRRTRQLSLANWKSSARAKAQGLVKQMSLSEKLSMGPYVGNVPAIERLGIPALHLEDGPQGVGDGTKGVTCWPNALAGVATWDRGTNIMLGPMTNIARVPTDGRAFESFGEDPYLAAEMVEQAVIGIQSQGVMACVKHWCNNNQEYHRQTVSADVDTRTEHEIYYPAFAAGAAAGAGSFMCSYNRVNGTHTCQNGPLYDVLYGEMDFQGFVMSDWGATHSTVESANTGLSMEMPGDVYFGEKLAEAVKSGEVSETRVTAMVTRILTSMFAVGIMDTPQTGNLSVNVESEAHTALAQRVAEQSSVLLKNRCEGELTTDCMLPLSNKLRKVAVIGDDAQTKIIATGGGSGHVICPYVRSPLSSIKARVGSSRVVFAPTRPVESAASLAAEADVAIVFVGVSSHEGADRANLSLGFLQDELVSAVAEAQRNTIVVVNCPGAVLMPWIDDVRAVVAAWLPGQVDGDAIVSVLWGDINPSGRLPLTFPVNETQNPLHTQLQYPGVNDTTVYSEKLLVGYRWYDDVDTTPLFPFGHGLSYTTFQYSDLVLSGSLSAGASPRRLKVVVNVTNTGNTPGREVVQLYLGYPRSAGEPPHVLRGFEMTHMLQPGQVEAVVFYLFEESVSTWSASESSFVVSPGEFSVLVGASSRDFRAGSTFSVS